MDHSMSSTNSACQVSMLWNWYTVDSCFLAESWHITTSGAFAATCIGTILLVVLVEFTRRLSREYDEFIRRQFSRQALKSRSMLSSSSANSSEITFWASPLQQLLRAVLYAVTVAGAYILMLIAMSFNGYVIICIFIGAALGKFLCDWLVVKVETSERGVIATSSKEDNEAAVCCV